MRGLLLSGASSLVFVAVSVAAMVAQGANPSVVESNERDRVQTLERRLEELERETAAELKQTQERRAAEAEQTSKAQLLLLKEAADQSHRTLLWVLSVGGLLGVIGAGIGVWRERTSDQRSARFHEEVTRIAKAHADAAELAAKAATGNISSLTATLESFQKILKFKVLEAQQSATQLEQLNERLKELDAVERGQIEALLQEAKDLRRPRHVYTSQEPTLRRQLEEFARRFDLLPKEVIERYEKNNPGERTVGMLGEMHLRRGIAAYYDNDPVRALRVLETASGYFRKLPGALTGSTGGTSGTLDNRGQAFSEFYLALVHKNYGDSREAQRHIERSYELHGSEKQMEMLTPTTRAEILSYLPNKEVARSFLAQLVGQWSKLTALAPHDDACLARCQLMLGNTFYVAKDWTEAMKHYEAALASRNAAKYYVLYSQALVHDKLHEGDAAEEKRRAAYDALLKSRHLETKKALDTQLSLHALAHACSPDLDTAEDHFDKINDILSRIHDLGGLEVRLFSFEKKKQVDKTEWMKDMMEAVAHAHTTARRHSGPAPKRLSGDADVPEALG
jgi:tetratricopeptide (TPR) repeat protein